MNKAFENAFYSNYHVNIGPMFRFREDIDTTMLDPNRMCIDVDGCIFDLSPMNI